MTERVLAADDYGTIRTELRRNRVVEMCVSAGLPSTGMTPIPDEIFLAAGFSKEEIAALPGGSRKWPLLESELRGAPSALDACYD